jgi:enamine deaminase RidA (YjgF/YER057c/UK114 family)
MTLSLRLTRAGQRPSFPPTATCGRRFYLHVLHIPDRDNGHAIQVDEFLGESGQSLIEAQTRHCLESLKTILTELGGSLDRVLKADVHLVDAVDFCDFKLVWREYFPNLPPARTTVEVGDFLPFRSVRLNLDVVALAGDASVERIALRDPYGPDPLEAEWATPAVQAGNLVFCSGFTASDFKTGLAVSRRPGFTNYGSEAEMQAHHIFTALNRVLAQAGTSLEQAVESQLYEPDLGTFHDVDGVWVRYMPVPPPRSSMGVKGLIVAGAHLIANLTVLVPDAAHVKEESREGIRWHPM